MNVALLGSARSIHTVRWANGLSERGHTVHLLSLDDPSSDIVPAVHQYKLPYGAPLGYFLAAGRLRQLLTRIKPDLLNTHYASGYGVLARRSRYLPNLLSAWGSDIYDFPDKSRWHRKTLCSNLDQATALGATSQAMAIKMRALSDTPLFVTPFGIDEHQFAPSVAPSPSDRIIIGTVKTLEALYGIDTLIHAFAKLRARLAPTHPDLAARLMLRIYGGGSQFRMLTAMAGDLGLDDCVELKGQIPHCDVPAALDELDIYVALSRRDSFGVAILEACSCGLPVVVSDADGPAEVVLDGVTGFVVPIEDADAAASRLETLVLDSRLRAAMGAAGRMRVREKYSWNHSLDLMQQAYDETLRIHRGARAHGTS
ncbi:glycosyltransferase [Achromobacter pulmonis]|uniref:glycosyltransferase n=1 Tax=Achromobacter pulmonis TaxID=1389932 RepID=UPI001FD1DADD|nr:glycosyltransferase [Achromobacter pulmonis]